MNEILMIFLEKVCEALYFSLFIIYGKKLKEKRILFTIIMIFEYLLLTNVFCYCLWMHVLYFIMTYINLKVLYKEKSQITDIFLMAVASIVLLIINALVYFAFYFTYNNYLIAIITCRIILFLFLILFKNKLGNLYTRFYSVWNRHSDKTKIRSLTLRNISIIIFNLMFYFINLGLSLCLLIGKR